MEILVYGILPIGGSLFLYAMLYYGAYRIGGRPPVTWKRIAVAVSFALVSVMCSMLGSTWVNLFFTVLFPFVAGWVFKATRASFSLYIVLSVAVFLTDAAVVICIQLLWIRGIFYVNDMALGYVLLVSVTRMLEFMVILLITLGAEKRAGGHIAVRQVLLSVLLPLFSVFNLYFTIYLIRIFFVWETMVLFLINLVLLIGLNLYFCLLVDTMSENHRLENERNLYRQQAMQYQYYEREEEKYEQSRKLIHDIRNHIQAMEGLYNREGAVEAARYAGDIHKMLNQFGQKYYTSEKLLNLILNDKASVMQRAGVREDMKVGELSLDFMESTDVTALFANLLDNGIAAARKSREGYVRLRVGMARQFLSIVMENSCDRKPDRAGGGYRSSKEGHEGLGLKIILKTVQQYGGDGMFEWKDGVFYTRIMLAAGHSRESGLS